MLAELTAPGLAGADLVAHGPAAVRRRWTRAEAIPVVAAAALIVLMLTGVGAPGWTWVVLGVGALVAALLAVDRSRALGHRVDEHWLIARSGSLDRRRDCIAAAGIIGWTVRQTPFQRRAGVATLVAATAAGAKAYRVLDVPEDVAWSVAATASPWVADCAWAHPSGR